MKKAVVAAVLLTVGTAGGLAIDRERPDGQQPAEGLTSVHKINSPSVMWWGSSSGVTRPSYQRITTSADWKGVWRRLAGEGIPPAAVDRLCPTVDFTKSVVVVVYAGTQLGKTAVMPDLVNDNKDEVQRVRLHLEQGAVRDRRECTPYVIFLAPRTDKQLVLEEWDERGAWRVRAQFPKLP